MLLYLVDQLVMRNILVSFQHSKHMLPLTRVKHPNARQLLVRYASKGAKAQKAAAKAKVKRVESPPPPKQNQPRPPPPPQKAKPFDRIKRAGPAEAGVNERTIYQYTGERLPDIRLVIGAGVTISCMVRSSKWVPQS